MGRTGGLFLLAIAVVAVPLMAVASPQDPTWVAGIYDASDCDDVATLASEPSAAGNELVYELSPPAASSENLIGPDRRERDGTGWLPGMRGPPKSPPWTLFFAPQRVVIATTPENSTAPRRTGPPESRARAFLLLSRNSERAARVEPQEGTEGGGELSVCCLAW